MKTIPMVMEQTGCTRREIQHWCAVNRIEKIGPLYVLTDEDIERFKNRKGPGRPRKKESV